MLEPHIDLKPDTKVLSFRFSPEYYTFLNNDIQFKYFIIPNIKYMYYNKPYREQISYVRNSQVDVLIFTFDSYTTLLPKNVYSSFREYYINNYVYLGDLIIYEKSSENPKVFIKKNLYKEQN